MTTPTLQRKLTLFDVTNLVVGAIIGADIYVASSFGAQYLGPVSLAVWVIAGFIAIIIALCFAQCAGLVPKVGSLGNLILNVSHFPMHSNPANFGLGIALGWVANLLHVLSQEGNRGAQDSFGGEGSRVETIILAREDVSGTCTSANKAIV